MLRAHRFFPLLICMACLSACAPDGTNAAIRSAAKSGRVDVGVDDAPRTVALQFEAKKAGTRPLPFPFVDAEVNGQATRFLLDTGATGHSIDRTIANGASDSAAIVVTGWGKLRGQPIAVVDLPEAVRSRGIGGVLSPQLLAKTASPTQALVVDFVRSQLRAQERAAARASVEELGIMISPAAKSCASANVAGVAGSLVVVDATVDGAGAKLVADTGTSRSFLTEGSPAAGKAAGHPMLGRSITYSRMGELPLTLYGGASVAAGSWSNSADIGVGAGATDDGCGAQGRLGMDALQRCALVFSGDDLVLGCRPPIAR